MNRLILLHCRLIKDNGQRAIVGITLANLYLRLVELPSGLAVLTSGNDAVIEVRVLADNGATLLVNLPFAQGSIRVKSECLVRHTPAA